METNFFIILLYAGARNIYLSILYYILMRSALSRAKYEMAPLGALALPKRNKKLDKQERISYNKTKGEPAYEHDAKTAERILDRP